MSDVMHAIEGVLYRCRAVLARNLVDHLVCRLNRHGRVCANSATVGAGGKGGRAFGDYWVGNDAMALWRAR